MRHYDFEDSDEQAQQQIEEFFVEPDENTRYMQMTQIGLASQQINMKLMELAIHTAEKTFLWRFKKHEEKMKLIFSTYANLLEMIRDDDLE